MDGAAGPAARGLAEGPGGRRVEEAREECPSEAAGAEHLHCFCSASPRGGRRSGVAVAITLWVNTDTSMSRNTPALSPYSRRVAPEEWLVAQGCFR